MRAGSSSEYASPPMEGAARAVTAQAEPMIDASFANSDFPDAEENALPVIKKEPEDKSSPGSFL